MIKEVWKDIPKYVGLYQVSSLGRVKRLVGYGCKATRILRPGRSRYLFVRLCKEGTSKLLQVHRLVALCFIGASRLTVDHIDNDRWNNAATNLQYLTRGDNSRKAVKEGYGAKHNYINNATHKLNLLEREEIKRIGYALSQSVVAEIYGVSQSAVSRVRTLTTFKNA